MNPVIVSCGWDKVVKVSFLQKFISLAIVGLVMLSLFASSEGDPDETIFSTKISEALTIMSIIHLLIAS